MTFRLPWPPSVNRKQRYPTKREKEFRAEAIADIRRQIGHWQYACRVRVHLALTPPTKQTRDADNHIKSVLDAITAAELLADDSAPFVKSVTAEWTDRVGGLGCCDVTIEPVEG